MCMKQKEVTEPRRSHACEFLNGLTSEGTIQYSIKHIGNVLIRIIRKLLFSQEDKVCSIRNINGGLELHSRLLLKTAIHKKDNQSKMLLHNSKQPIKTNQPIALVNEGHQGDNV